MFTLSVEFPWLYFTRAKRSPMCSFQSCQQKKREMFCDLGSSSGESPAAKKRYSTYLEKNNQNLRETSSEHGFLPLALVVLFEDVPPFGTPQKAASGKTSLQHPLQPKCRSTSPWREIFPEILGIRILKKSADSTWQVPSPPVSEVIKLLSR